MSEQGDRGGGAVFPPARSQFQKATSLPKTTVATMAKVIRCSDQVRVKAENHYEKHRERWVAKHYTQLLLKTSPTLSLTPPGIVSDPRAALMSRARNEVAYKQVQRLGRIDKTKEKLLETGRLRPTRAVNWGENQRKSVTIATARSSSNGSGGDKKQKTAHSKIATAQDHARRRAEVRLVKNQERWTGTRFTQVVAMLGSSNRSSLVARHIGDVAMAVANCDVKAKHEARLQRIDRACDNMRSTGKVRESRPVGRNLALGR